MKCDTLVKANTNARFVAKGFLKKGIILPVHKIMNMVDRILLVSIFISSEVRNHELQHGTEKNFCCNLCGKSFKRDAYLRIHMNTHQKKEQPSLQVSHPGPPESSSRTFQDLETTSIPGFVSRSYPSTLAVETRIVYIDSKKELHRLEQLRPADDYDELPRGEEREEVFAIESDGQTRVKLVGQGGEREDQERIYETQRW